MKLKTILLSLLMLSPVAYAQSIIINNGTEPSSIDPQATSGVPESRIERQLFEGLVNADPNGKVVPGVASSWESKDNKVWIFHLRPNAKWSNGEPVTAHDFVYAWQRAVDPKTGSPLSSFFRDDMHVHNANAIIRGQLPPDQLGVKALDDHTLEVTLDDPVPYFVSTLLVTATDPVPAKIIAKYGDKWTQPGHIVSNGAYQLESWVVNGSIKMKRNPYYWDAKHVAIDQVTFLMIPNTEDEYNRYLTNALDVSSSDLNVDIIPKIKKDFPHELHIGPRACTYFYEFNTQKPPFNDARVRVALDMALNRKIYTDKILRLGQKPAYTLTPDFTADYLPFTPKWAKWPMAKRIVAAKKLLAEAGYGPSHPLTFTLLYNTSESHKKYALVLAALYKQELGFVHVKLENQEWKTFMQTRRDGGQQMARASWCADYNAAPTYLNVLLSNSSVNRGRYHSQAYDQVMQDTLNPALSLHEREKLYQKASQIASDDAAVLPVFTYISPRLIKPYVKGYTGRDPMDYLTVKFLSIKKSQH